MKFFPLSVRVLPIILPFFSYDLIAGESIRGNGIRRHHNATSTESFFVVSPLSSSVVEDHPVVYPPGYPMNITTHRRLATASGTRTVLIIRVIANGVAPTVSAAELRQAAFGSGRSMLTQFRDCSEGRLNMVQSQHGVRDLRINANPSNIREMITVSQTSAGQLGLGNLKSAANHVLFVFPEQGSSYVAEAEITGSYSWYNNRLALSHSVLVHEVCAILSYMCQRSLFRAAVLYVVSSSDFPTSHTKDSIRIGGPQLWLGPCRKPR